jgi:antitoxin component of RelBE/YafQ-DinJ toxin-antitoxin module
MTKTTNSTTTNMNIRLDVQTRRELKKFADKVGIPASSLVNASIREMLRKQEITLSTLEPTPYLEKIINEAEADYAAGKNIVATNTDEETLEYLRSL